MKKIVRLTESDLTRIVKRVINEQTVKTVTMKLDCDKETIEGLPLSPEQIKNFCWSGRFGQPGGGGSKPSGGGSKPSGGGSKPGGGGSKPGGGGSKPSGGGSKPGGGKY
jgi:hypothetical protein